MHLALMSDAFKSIVAFIHEIKKKSLPSSPVYFKNVGDPNCINSL